MKQSTADGIATAAVGFVGFLAGGGAGLFGGGYLARNMNEYDSDTLIVMSGFAGAAIGSMLASGLMSSRISSLRTTPGAVGAGSPQQVGAGGRPPLRFP